ncbi:hypothetical protein RRG08_058631 [Elysia crispata]|uniref:Uncharacterized protein n=1 Tax=Elysia crispata TaxID=231223 RepID=A0AAE1D8T1_9GAST|nr:hypothetical protein RRG08_058631 [Elysia crispata]
MLFSLDPQPPVIKQGRAENEHTGFQVRLGMFIFHPVPGESQMSIIVVRERELSQFTPETTLNDVESDCNYLWVSLGRMQENDLHLLRQLFKNFVERPGNCGRDISDSLIDTGLVSHRNIEGARPYCKADVL